MEELTIEICNEYRKKGKALGDSPLCVGAKADLVKELMERCGISELWALNIINGYNVSNYIAIVEHKKTGGVEKSEKDKEYLEWLAQKEDKEKMDQMILDDLMDD